MRRLVFLLSIFFSSLITINAVNVQGISYQTVETLGSIGLRVTNVEYRKDLTRVYAEIIGIPHTAARIDSMTLILPSGKSLSWTDIDGIDANRYFQWEDNGRISIEIDFPPVKQPSSFKIKASGPKGEYLWKIKTVKKTK